VSTIMRTGWLILAAMIAMPLVVACSVGASAVTDAGHATVGDAALGDTGAPRSDAGASSDGGGVANVDAGAEADETAPGYAAACLDGIDQNAGGGLDCSDSSCAAAPSCCVGVSTSRCCTIAGPSISLDFACATAPCDALTGFSTFGDGGPIRTSDMAFAPVSDHGTDSGAILGQELDVRSTIVTLTAALAVPAHTSDVDAIGVGLVTGGPSAHVVPLAAVVVSASRGQILLLLGESIAGVAPAPTDEMPHDYSLTVDPMGAVTLDAGAVHLSAHVALPEMGVHAAFFGRATNPGAVGTSLPARIASLHISSTGCDQPTALTRLGPVAIVDHTGAALLDTASDPSLASDTAGTTTVLAFAAESMGSPTSAIFVAVRETDGAFHVRAPAAATQPILAPPPGDAFESPALTFSGGVWTLYATRVHAGARSIVTAHSTTADVLTLGAPMDILTPEVHGDVSSPAPVPGDPTRIVVRHLAPPGEVTMGRPELVLLNVGSGATATPSADLCGAIDTCAPGARAESRLYAARDATITFDADDVDDPAIVFYDHVYRLYYAGRLASRWSIGMLITADLGYWRPANGGAAVLAPDGSGFDAVTVRSPAPLVEAGRLSLYYLGSDGDTRTIARAQGGTITP
jgi:hypothetical protein